MPLRRSQQPSRSPPLRVSGKRPHLAGPCRLALVSSSAVSRLSLPPHACLRRLQTQGSSSNSSAPRSPSPAAREVLLRPIVAAVPCSPRRRALSAILAARGIERRSPPLVSSTSAAERDLERRRPFFDEHGRRRATKSWHINAVATPAIPSALSFLILNISLPCVLTENSRHLHFF
jgi:hypothetical protein